jgi:hypothetical protein
MVFGQVVEEGVEEKRVAKLKAREGRALVRASRLPECQISSVLATHKVHSSCPATLLPRPVGTAGRGRCKAIRTTTVAGRRCWSVPLTVRLIRGILSLLKHKVRKVR